MSNVNPVDVVANVATGGLYGAGKSALDVITGKTDILSGVKDSMNTLGPWGSVMMGVSPEAAMAGNVAGAGAGVIAGGMSSFSPSGFGAADTTIGSGVAPSALTSTTGEAIANAPSTVTAIPAAAEPSAYVPGQAPPLLNPTSAAHASGVTSTVANDIANAGKSFSMIPEGAGPAATQSWWDAQPAAVKAAIAGGGIFAGGQMLTGAAGGYFTGLSAEKKLQLEQLINQQNQNQRQYLNKNNQYAPLLKFQSSAVPAATSTNPSLLNAPPLVSR